MSDYEGTILFKDWLPDQPDLNNPGLTEALNVLPVDDKYISVFDLLGTGTSLNALPRGAFRTQGTAGSSVYVGTDVQLFRRDGSGWTANSVTVAPATYWRFAQYDDLVIAVGDTAVPLAVTNGSASSFTLLATAGSAPVARHIGRIGQFVMVGDLVGAEPHAVQWPAIDDPRNWPTPSSSTAIATQSGKELLGSDYGAVTGIFGGDQFGVIMQQAALTRATYVGGDTVFQFDRFSTGIGAWFPNGSIQVGELIYFVSDKGFYVTNGVNVEPIGDGKVDRYFLSRVDYIYPERVTVAVDWKNSIISWCFPTTSDSGQPTQLLNYNWRRKRWSRTNQTCSSLIYGTPVASYSWGQEGFDSARKLGVFPRSQATGSGSVPTAVLTTGEMEINPGGFAALGGVKALIDSTLNAVTYSDGYRNAQSDAVTYATDQTANARSGFANFRPSARFHRARLTITGTFNAAQGIEHQAAPDGYT